MFSGTLNEHTCELIYSVHNRCFAKTKKNELLVDICDIEKYSNLFPFQISHSRKEAVLNCVLKTERR